MWLADNGLTTRLEKIRIRLQLTYLREHSTRGGLPVSWKRIALLLVVSLVVTPLTAIGASALVQSFSDVPTTHPFFDEIEWMADRGISTGYADGTYRPSADVTRQAMSAFMYRLAELATPTILSTTGSGLSNCAIGPYVPPYEQQAVFNGGNYSNTANLVMNRVQYRVDGGSWNDVTDAWFLPDDGSTPNFGASPTTGVLALDPGLSYEFAMGVVGTGGDSGCALTVVIFHRMPGQGVGGETPSGDVATDATPDGINSGG